MNNPYKVIFESLPFDDAVDFSITYAKNKVRKYIDVKIEVVKFVHCEAGFIPLYTPTKDDFSISFNMLMKPQIFWPNVNGENYMAGIDPY